MHDTRKQMKQKYFEGVQRDERESRELIGTAFKMEAAWIEPGGMGGGQVTVYGQVSSLWSSVFPGFNCIIKNDF